MAFSEKSLGKGVCLIRVNSLLLWQNTHKFSSAAVYCKSLRKMRLWFPKMTWLWALNRSFWVCIHNIAATKVSWSTSGVMMLQSHLSTGLFSPLSTYFLAVLSFVTYSSHSLACPPFCRLSLDMSSTETLHSVVPQLSVCMWHGIGPSCNCLIVGVLY